MKKKYTYKDLTKEIRSLRYFKELHSLLQSYSAPLNVRHLHGSLKSFTIAALWEEQARPLIIFAPDRKAAEDMYFDLSLAIDKEHLALLAEPEKTLHTSSEILTEPLVWLADGLSRMQTHPNTIAIAVPEIFSMIIPKPESINSSRIEIFKGQTLSRDELVMQLSLNGFERKDYVAMQGDIAVRGGIVDIFPVGWENPLRIEFWGDDVEALRCFDTLSQRSISEHKSVEFISNIFNEITETDHAALLDYINPESVIVIDEPDMLEQKEQMPSISVNFKTIFFNKLGNADVQVRSNPQPQIKSSIKSLNELIDNYFNKHGRIFLTAEGAIHLNRFRDMIENSGAIESEFRSEDALAPAPPKEITASIEWLDNSPSAGWELADSGLALFTEHQVFSRLRTRTERPSRAKSGGFTIKELKQLNIGDFVVHDDKGIGRFEGFKSITMGGAVNDCVRLAFADGDVLYVQINFIHKLQKYSSQEGNVPKLTKLGSGEWARKKAKTKKKLKDIARDLIKLYAMRKAQAGFAFHADTVWQKEFEASFIYEDTPDQATTTEEVKRDMESRTPMDRLVCGDVGFGKTEIAIRAAFKAVQSGKQVAVLVPTTVLAQQHYLSFSDRLENYPVKVAPLSRFVGTSTQKETLDKLETGRVDILIGTHRILSKDVKFKDLGLLIIDEEHRFGVGSKEKLRQLKATIDTLTLTATPIPRTLNFSLMGARDLSVIETPPRNRLPIYTEIMEWNNKEIVKAINREIERSGQVFFVTDKVGDIDKITRDLQMLMPTLRFGIAHGQMSTKELEKVMEKFVSKKLDVLVATKIVESGLDIPNANTIIINRAQNFGLAELYQLRGRVGRSNRQAFCYLLIPPVKTISTNTLRRLQAIEEFTDLGSGFQLAMRDMEIRGAGNLLGAEQSGMIIEIGFELFNKILDEAVSELREEEFAELFEGKLERKPRMFKNEDLVIDLDADAFIPPEYIQSDTDRFYFYKKMYNTVRFDELSAVVDELTDKYGKYPPNVKNLIFAVKLRIALLDTGFVKLTLKHSYLLVEFPPKENKEFYERALPVVMDFIQGDERCLLKQSDEKLELGVQLGRRDEAVEFVWRLKNLMLSEFSE